MKGNSFFHPFPALNYKSALTNFLHATTAAILLSSVYFSLEIWMASRPSLKVIRPRSAFPDASLLCSFCKVVWLFSVLHSNFYLFCAGKRKCSFENTIWKSWLLVNTRLFDFVVQKPRFEWIITPLAAKHVEGALPVICKQCILVQERCGTCKGRVLSIQHNAITFIYLPVFIREKKNKPIDPGIQKWASNSIFASFPETSLKSNEDQLQFAGSLDRWKVLPLCNAMWAVTPLNQRF